MTGKIIQLSAFSKLKKPKSHTCVLEDCEPDTDDIPAFMIPREVKRLERANKAEEEGLSITCRNQRLRDQRRDAWRAARVAKNYWKSALEMHDAIGCAQRANLPEGKLHPAFKPDDRWPMLDKYRAALVLQLLTPAPDMAAVLWKRAQLKAGNHEYTDKTERLERAIADDVAFLAAHPTRNKRAN